MEQMDERSRYLQGSLGHDMEHQDAHIPEDIAQEWQAVEVELWQASRELEAANRRYQAAILARIALSQRLKD